MRPVAPTREPSRSHIAVAVGIGVAFVAAVLMLYRLSALLPPKLESRRYEAGVATSRVLVDSPHSQVVDLGDKSGDTQGSATDLAGLSFRAHLMANLMATSPLKERIAASAQIAPDRLTVTGPTGDGPDPASLPSPPRVHSDDPEATILDLSVDEALPIITMSVRAPDAATAKSVASATARQLREYVASLSAARAVPPEDELVVSQLGAATSETVLKGPRRSLAIAVFVVLASLWIALVLVSRRVARLWKELAAQPLGEA
jgi:hypothetical protein